MRTLRTPGWVILAALVAGNMPLVAIAADKDQTDKALEGRVRALEKKMDMQQQGEAAEKQSVQQRIKAIEQEVKDTEKSIADKLGVTMHGVVAVDYLYDFNAPNVVVNGTRYAQPFLRTFENEKNSVILNEANLRLERNSENGVGFLADLDFGKTGDVVNNTTYFGRRDSAGTPITGNGTDFFDATQFYLTYTVPVGSGIKLKAGRFVTLAGAEVIKVYNNLNYNVTNSILFGFAIPFTHTGLMASYAFNDLVSLDLGLVNGWDDVVDNNDGKTVHGGLNITPDPRFSIYITGTYGPEQPNSGRSKRFLVTTLFTVKATDQLTFIIDYNYGNESNIVLSPPPPGVPIGGTVFTGVNVPGNTDWQGVAGYVVYSPIEELALTFRAEVFNDPDGVRTLVQQPGFGPGATYWELTPTVTYKITDGLFWRNEYRHDEACRKVFPNQNTFVSGQDTVATELVYTF